MAHIIHSQEETRWAVRVYEPEGLQTQVQVWPACSQERARTHAMQVKLGAKSSEHLFMQYTNNKDADQPAHPNRRSLISIFVVGCQDSTISMVAISCSFNLICSWAGHVESYMVAKLQRQVFSWCGSVIRLPHETQFVFKYFFFLLLELNTEWFEPPHDKINHLTCAPSEDSDQPGHPHRVFAVVRMKKDLVLSYPLSAQ